MGSLGGVRGGGNYSPDGENAQKERPPWEGPEPSSQGTDRGHRAAVTGRRHTDTWR